MCIYSTTKYISTNWGRTKANSGARIYSAGYWVRNDKKQPHLAMRNACFQKPDFCDCDWRQRSHEIRKKSQDCQNKFSGCWTQLQITLEWLKVFEMCLLSQLIRLFCYSSVWFGVLVGVLSLMPAEARNKMNFNKCYKCYLV